MPWGEHERRDWIALVPFDSMTTYAPTVWNHRGDGRVRRRHSHRQTQGPPHITCTADTRGFPEVAGTCWVQSCGCWERCSLVAVYGEHRNEALECFGVARERAFSAAATPQSFVTELALRTCGGVDRGI